MKVEVPGKVMRACEIQEHGYQVYLVAVPSVTDLLGLAPQTGT